MSVKSFLKQHYLGIVFFILASAVAVAAPHYDGPTVVGALTNNNLLVSAAADVTVPKTRQSENNLQPTAHTQPSKSQKTKPSLQAAIAATTLSPVLEADPQASEPAPIQLAPTIPATLALADKTYVLGVPEQSTIYDSMKLLAAKTDFTFSGKDYGAMGYFVEEINGKKQNPRAGEYWIYSINGTEAAVGISSYTIKPNDIISWSYENEK